MPELSQEQQSAIRKVELLMRKANGNANEHEAAACIMKAQELLTKHNLDHSAVGKGGDTGTRSKDKTLGGFYKHEQDLWRAVAELNFCWYYSIVEYVTPEEAARLKTWSRNARHHYLIGRTVNVLSTKLMAEYLLAASERLTAEYMTETTGSYTSQVARGATAVSFRKGCASRLVEKLQVRRWEIIQEERRKAEQARSSGQAGGVALTVAGLTQAEYEANYDFTYGEGAYANMKATSAEYRAKLEEKEALAAKWRLENPEAAAKQDAAARKADEANQRKQQRQRSRKEAPAASDMAAYRAGYRDAGEIGLDAQVQGTRVAGRLR